MCVCVANYILFILASDSVKGAHPIRVVLLVFADSTVVMNVVIQLLNVTGDH